MGDLILVGGSHPNFSGEKEKPRSKPHYPLLSGAL